MNLLLPFFSGWAQQGLGRRRRRRLLLSRLGREEEGGGGTQARRRLQKNGLGFGKGGRKEAGHAMLLALSLSLIPQAIGKGGGGLDGNIFFLSSLLRLCLCAGVRVPTSIPHNLCSY